MRIVHAVHGAPPELIGGTELYVARLARSQVTAGHDVFVFSGSIDWREEFFEEDAVVDGVPVRRVHRNDLYFDRWDKGYHPRVSDRWDAALEEWRPDLVHVHHWIRLTTDLVRVAARRGVPAVVSIHDLLPTCPRVFRLKDEQGEVACDEPMGEDPCVPCVPRWRFQGDEEIARSIIDYRDDMREELRTARAVTAPTAEHGAFCASRLDADVEVEALPLGSVTDPSIPRPPSSEDGTDGRIHVAAWGNLHPLKGAHVVLEALAKTRDPSRFVLRLLGAPSDDAYDARLRELAEGLDVTFTGKYTASALAAAPMDLAVLPTLCRESWSFVLDEASRLGVPIVATDFGAVRDRATDRMMLFARNDAGSLATRLDAFADDASRAAAMRAAPAPEVVEFGEHAAKVDGIYARVLAGGAPPVPPSTDTDRLRMLWERREAHFKELVRSEGWPDLVAGLEAKITALEERLRSGDG